MKALQVNFSDFTGGGGGAVAMQRLCQGLAQLDIDYGILGKVKTLDSEKTALVPRLRPFEGGLKRITKILGFNDIHTIGTFTLNQHDFFKSADILNFHIIHSDYFNYLALPFLTAQKPAVFTLHDMWAFTGHCSYSYDCDRWLKGCGACPYPNTYPSIQRDSTHLEWLLKKWAYSKSRITIVSPSHWLTEQAQKSILNCFDIFHIPYGLDTKTYVPTDRLVARRTLGLPEDRYILMSCAESFSDRRKGMDLLVESLNRLPYDLKSKSSLLLMGHGAESISQTLEIPTISLGFVSSDHLKSLAYSSADVFLFPTRADNLPIVLQESMSCGTPMVSFDVGGVPDLVRHQITGLLAPPESVEAFTANIVTMLMNDERRKEMALNCRRIATQEYPIELQAQRYRTLYETIIHSNRQI